MARPRTDIQPRILAAARALFQETGVDANSLRKIARSAGTSSGMVSYYYPTKDDLFAAVVEETYGVLLADIALALRPDAPVEERLRRVLHRASRLSDAELATVKLVISEMLGSPTRRRLMLERFLRGHLPLLLLTIVEGIGDGTLRADLPPPLLMVATFAMGVLPQVIRRAVGDQPMIANLPGGTALADVLLDLVLSGVAARGE